MIFPYKNKMRKKFMWKEVEMYQTLTILFCFYGNNQVNYLFPYKFIELTSMIFKITK